MRTSSIIFLSFALHFSALAEAGELTARLQDGLLYDGHLICLFEDGSVAAWEATSGQPDYELASRLRRPSIHQIESDGTRLWAVGNQTLYSWETDHGKWQVVDSLRNSQLLSLVVVDSLPVLVYEKAIELPTTGKTFKVPKLRGQLDIDYLRVLATYALGATLWIGTGQGEWGGHLVSLNIRTGKWRQYYDPLHYATGISSADRNTLYVSWSMSHFMADTLIRIHNRKGKPTHSYQELNGKYLQSIAFSDFDGRLYGVEQNTVVRIEDGVPTPIADLGKLSYEIEPNAIGVAPAVHSLIPVDKELLVILHKNAPPFLLHGDALVRLDW